MHLTPMLCALSPITSIAPITRIAGVVLAASGLASAVAPFAPPALHMPRTTLMWVLVAGALMLMAGSVTQLLSRPAVSAVARRPAR
jgi:hypothetical protein